MKVVWVMENYKFYQSKLSKKYMSGVVRSHERISNSSEVFTPEEYVEKELDKLNQKYFIDASLTLIDPCAGDGNMLAMMLLRRIKNGIDFETALSTIFGVELLWDNVILCRARLLCGRTELAHIVQRNIVVHDARTYDYSFNGTNKNNDEMIRDRLFE